MKLKKLDLDQHFVFKTQPAGGIDTRNELYLNMGDHYMTTIHIFDIPEEFSDFWLTGITEIPGVTTTVDTVNNTKADFVDNIAEAITELTVQLDHAKNIADSDEIQNEIDPLRSLSLALRKDGEVIRQTYIRVYCYAATRDQLERKVNEVVKQIRKMSFKASVFLGEGMEEYQAMFLPAGEQRYLKNAREGIPLSGEVLGLSFAHNQTSLNDPFGSYFGYTQTGGTVYWDQFLVDKQRTYYNLFLSGDLGSGKSTQLKKIIWERAIRSDLVRIFDRSGEFRDTVHALGGKVVSLDGRDGTINLLQVYPSVTVGDSNEVDPVGSYKAHLKDLSVKYRLFNHDASGQEAQYFATQCDGLYRQLGLLGDSIGLTQKPFITERDANDYPTLSQLIDFVDQKRQNRTDDMEKKLLDHIYVTLNNLRKTYGELFDVHSTLPDYDGERSLEDIHHFLLVVDECHTLLNTNKAYVADLFVRIMSEDRKAFGAICLATQRLERMFPSGDNAQDRDTVSAINALRQIYTLCQYKIVLKHDATTIGTEKNPRILRQLLGDILSPSEFLQIPKFDKGEAMFLLGSEKLHMHFQVTKQELAIFKGGA
ncbi:type IV secretory pathway, VirB4 component [Lacticaseibacillus paracasei subsp. paracasei Lpp14]|uniref:Type IV secretory pathway, VirB4 component n=1 Tax=Lacticaseibacillus paracasei subsp. paracasei Lpp14 TaxID=1256204 RepID=A0A829GRF8_LACPA|nr:type IV secretory pathway, VirB4 component [Lacticaseibacillus paracasei subsp. paracasei Lpp14]